MDIDLFGNIDNFLQESPKSEYKINDEDDSYVLNENSGLSVPVVTENKFKRRKKTTTTTKYSNIFDSDDDDLITQNKSNKSNNITTKSAPTFKAGKGQKLAVQRFEKIREKLESNVKYAELDDSLVMETVASTVTQPQPNKKPSSKSKTIRESAITARPRRAHRPCLDTVDLTDEIPLFSGSRCMSSSSAAGPSRTKTSADADSDVSFSSENYTVTVKINWYSEILKIDLRKYQKFSDLCQTLGELKGIDPTTIVLMMNDVIVNAATETPDSIGYTIGKFISARSVQNIDIRKLTSGSSSSSRNVDGKNDEPEIKLKIQCANRKKPLFVTIKRSNKMKVIFIKLSEELNIPPNKLRLTFDGEPLDLEATPDELDIDDDELLDLRIVE